MAKLTLTPQEKRAVKDKLTSSKAYKSLPDDQKFKVAKRVIQNAINRKRGGKPVLPAPKEAQPSTTATEPSAGHSGEPALPQLQERGPDVEPPPAEKPTGIEKPQIPQTEEFKQKQKLAQRLHKQAREAGLMIEPALDVEADVREFLGESPAARLPERGLERFSEKLEQREIPEGDEYYYLDKPEDVSEWQWDSARRFRRELFSQKLDRQLYEDARRTRMRWLEVLKEAGRINKEQEKRLSRLKSGKAEEDPLKALIAPTEWREEKRESRRQLANTVYYPWQAMRDKWKETGEVPDVDEISNYVAQQANVATRGQPSPEEIRSGAYLGKVYFDIMKNATSPQQGVEAIREMHKNELRYRTKMKWLSDAAQQAGLDTSLPAQKAFSQLKKSSQSAPLPVSNGDKRHFMRAYKFWKKHRGLYELATEIIKAPNFTSEYASELRKIRPGDRGIFLSLLARADKRQHTDKYSVAQKTAIATAQGFDDIVRSLHETMSIAADRGGEARFLHLVQRAKDSLNPIQGQNWISDGLYKAARMSPRIAVTAPLQAVPNAGVPLAVAFWSQQSMPGIFNTLKDQGVEDDIAIPLAALGSLPYGAIEFFKIKGLLPPQARGAARQVAAKTVKQYLGKMAKETAKQTPKEILEEGAQALTESLTKDLASRLSKEAPNVDWDEELSNVAMEMKEAVVPLLFLQAGGMVSGGGGALSAARMGNTMDVLSGIILEGNPRRAEAIAAAENGTPQEIAEAMGITVDELPGMLRSDAVATVLHQKARQMRGKGEEPTPSHLAADIEGRKTIRGPETVEALTSFLSNKPRVVQKLAQADDSSEQALRRAGIRTEALPKGLNTKAGRAQIKAVAEQHIHNPARKLPRVAEVAEEDIEGIANLISAWKARDRGVGTPELENEIAVLQEQLFEKYGAPLINGVYDGRVEVEEMAGDVQETTQRVGETPATETGSGLTAEEAARESRREEAIEDTRGLGRSRREYRERQRVGAREDVAEEEAMRERVAEEEEGVPPSAQRLMREFKMNTQRLEEGVGDEATRRELQNKHNELLGQLYEAGVEPATITALQEGEIEPPGPEGETVTVTPQSMAEIDELRSKRRQLRSDDLSKKRRRTLRTRVNELVDSLRSDGLDYDTIDEIVAGRLEPQIGQETETRNVGRAADIYRGEEEIPQAPPQVPPPESASAQEEVAPDTTTERPAPAEGAPAGQEPRREPRRATRPNVAAYAEMAPRIQPDTPNAAINIRKEDDGWRAYWRDTGDEVFSGQVFDTAREARRTFQSARDYIREALPDEGEARPTEEPEPPTYVPPQGEEITPEGPERAMIPETEQRPEKGLQARAEQEEAPLTQEQPPAETEVPQANRDAAQFLREQAEQSKGKGKSARLKAADEIERLDRDISELAQPGVKWWEDIPGIGDKIGKEVSRFVQRSVAQEAQPQEEAEEVAEPTQQPTQQQPAEIEDLGEPTEVLSTEEIENLRDRLFAVEPYDIEGVDLQAEELVGLAFHYQERIFDAMDIQPQTPRVVQKTRAYKRLLRQTLEKIRRRIAANERGETTVAEEKFADQEETREEIPPSPQEQPAEAEAEQPTAPAEAEFNEVTIQYWKDGQDKKFSGKQHKQFIYYEGLKGNYVVTYLPTLESIGTYDTAEQAQAAIAQMSDALPQGNMITLDEVIENATEPWQLRKKWVSEAGHPDWVRLNHYKAVEDAIKRGEDVPGYVLIEYPAFAIEYDLVEKLKGAFKYPLLVQNSSLRAFAHEYRWFQTQGHPQLREQLFALADAMEAEIARREKQEQRARELNDQIKESISRPEQQPEEGEEPPSLNISESRAEPEEGLVSEERYNQAINRLRRMRPQTGIDPKMVEDLVTVGVYHIENAVRAGRKKIKSWWMDKMQTDLAASGIEVSKAELNSRVWKPAKQRHQKAAQREKRRKREQELKDKIKEAKETERDLQRLRRGLTNYVNDFIPAKHRRRLTNRIANSYTKGQIDRTADSVMSTAAALASREDNILTPKQMQRLKERHQAKGEARGFRKGKLQAKATQEDLIEYIETHLPVQERGRLLRTLKSAVTENRLKAARALVRRVHYNWAKKEADRGWRNIEKEARKIIGSKGRNPKVKGRFVDRIAQILENFRTSQPSQQALQVLHDTVEAENLNEQLREDIEYQLAKQQASETLDRIENSQLIRDMEPEHIELLTDALKRVIHEAKRVNQYERGKEERDLEKDVGTTVEELSQRAKVKFEGEGVGGGQPAKTNVMRRWWDNVMDGSRLFWNVTFNRESPFYRLYESILQGHIDKEGWLQKGMDFVNNAFQERGMNIDIKWILKHRNRSAIFHKIRKRKYKAEIVNVALPADTDTGLPEQTLRLDHASLAYASMFLDDPDSLSQVLKKQSRGFALPSQPEVTYKMTQERVKAIQQAAQNAGPEVQAMKDIIREWLNGQLFPAAQDAHESLKGFRMAEHVNHCPRYVNFVESGGRDSDPYQEMRSPEIANRGRFKERTGSTRSYFIFDIFDVMVSQTNTLADLISLAQPVKNANRFIHHPTMYQEIRKRLGPHMVSRFDDYLRNVAGSTKPLRQWHQKVVRFFKNNAVTSALAFLPRVMAIQSTSQLLTAYRVGMKSAAYGFKNTLWAGKRLKNEMMRNSPWNRARFTTATATQIMTPTQVRGDTAEIFLLGKAKQLIGMKGISWFDMKAIAGVWQSVKHHVLGNFNRRDLLKKDVDEWPENIKKEFLRQFHLIVTDTQPTFDMPTLSGLQQDARNEAFTSSLMTFMSFRTKAVNMLWETYMREKAKGSKSWRAQGIAKTAVLASYVIGMNMATKWLWKTATDGTLTAAIASLGDDDDDEKAKLVELQNKIRETNPAASWKSTGAKALSEFVALFPGGNLISQAGSTMAARMEGKRWRASASGSNVVLSNLDRLVKGSVKMFDAVSAGDDVLQSGPRKGESRRKVYAQRAAKDLAESIDGLFVGFGVRNIYNLTEDVGSNLHRIVKGDTEESLKKAYQLLWKDYYKEDAAGEALWNRQQELAQRGREADVKYWDISSRAKNWAKERYADEQ